MKKSKPFFWAGGGGGWGKCFSLTASTVNVPTHLNDPRKFDDKTDRMTPSNFTDFSIKFL